MGGERATISIQMINISAAFMPRYLCREDNLLLKICTPLMGKSLHIKNLAQTEQTSKFIRVLLARGSLNFQSGDYHYLPMPHLRVENLEDGDRVRRQLPKLQKLEEKHLVHPM